ncbi:U4/U6 small nuclear ribonucleoprotein PRP4 [Penicillium hispanicum]|uniref:U4/U6 small nuclear ribonucleoprotein PRP4 n=1 Tax=Penicillium hispanicum TaxID=1080232 RepID=UPI00253FE9AE|nr:U4/U6 small nuclear ribonucleoprotein PRP4 [Penicillium hispanicum]KAJ5580196.1 U4/U6 small nuclear ribonucleoprotein PRP4 [Penicillium hispanicum]
MSSPRWTSTLSSFPTSGFNLLDPSLEIEEETLPTYLPEKYYPVRQGEVLNERYQVLAKLGYGVTSTIYVTGQDRNRELDVHEHLNSVKSNHPGKRFIRKLFDHFHVIGPHRRHICLVHEPLGISASELLKWVPGQAMTLEDLKPCIRQLLVALDFLHSVARIVHTDIQLNNLLLPTPQNNALVNFEEKEIQTQSPRKVLKEHTIYTSSRFPPGDGLPLLSDFGEARFGDEEHHEDIMPNPYRAPEVILRSSWDYKVDIWNVGMVAWDIISRNRLINGKNPDGIFDDRSHLAELVALLGPPPPEFCERSHLSSVFWDKLGNWKNLAPIPNTSLEALAANVRGEDKAGFLRWLRMALQWNSEDRSTALDLLYDEWLMKGLKLGESRERGGP